MNPIFETELYKSAPLKTYMSISALSGATGIDKRYLKMAKKNGLDGFTLNSRVNWTTLKPLFEAAYDSLIDTEKDDILFWNKENKKKDAALKDLQIKKMEKNLVEPDDVRQLMVEIATKQSVVIKKVFNELPPKIAGKSEIDCKVLLDAAQQDIFNVLQNRIDTYK